MKYVFVALLAVIIAGLGSQTGVGLPLSNDGVKRVASSASRQVVFVDKAELAKLHPSWQALGGMRAALARASGKLLSADGIMVSRSAASSRTELAARAAVKASKALDELKARKYEALRIRSEATKAQKMQSAEMDWKADVRNIEESAAAEARVVDDRYSSELLNARLKAMAAAVASKVAGKDGSGMDRTVAEDTLKNTQGRLAAVGSADGLEKKAIAESATQKIDALKQASAKRVEEEVHAYELEQSKLIVDGIALAKDEIGHQMGPGAMVIAESKLAEGAIAESSAGSSTMTGSVGDLQAAVIALRARIDRDVDVVVRQLAASNGMAVVFQRRKSAPDATRTFAGFIKKRGWNAYSPVMGGAGSS